MNDDATLTDDEVLAEDSVRTERPMSPPPVMTDKNNTKDAEFVELVVKQIVEAPDEVEVVRTIDEMGVLITLKVSKDDMGKIIGKNGQTAKALRTLLRIIGSKNNARVNLKIIEPGQE